MKKILLFALLIGLIFATSKINAQVRVEVNQDFIYDGDTIRGTLLSSGKSLKKFTKIPLVIIINGSGPTDRDGNSILIPGKNNSFVQLADSLLDQGIATYRYDKLGIGASQMSKTEDELRFEDNVKVVKAAVSKMKELGFKNIYLLGHSEGSLVGILASAQTPVEGLISIAGASENAFETIKVQLQQNLPEAMAQSATLKLDSVKQGFTITSYDPSLAALLRPSVQPYLQSYFKYTPTEEIAKLDKPVLILHGGQDLQVEEENARALQQAKPEATLHIYPSMNHVLKKVDESREQNIAAYRDPDFPLEKDLASDIAEWIGKNTP